MNPNVLKVRGKGQNYFAWLSNYDNSDVLPVFPIPASLNLLIRQRQTKVITENGRDIELDPWP